MRDKKIETQSGKPIGICLETLSGHQGTVNCLMELKNGLLASGSDDSTIKLWRFENGRYRCIQTLKEHKWGVRCLTELSSGFLASGANDNRIILWSFEDGQYHYSQTLNEHKWNIGCLIELKSRLLASGSDDKTIKLWRFENRMYRCIQTLNEHSSLIWCLTELRSGLLASGDFDGTIKFWRLENRSYRCIQTLEYAGPIYFLTELRSGLLVSGSGHLDPMINLWCIEEDDQYKCIHTQSERNQGLSVVLAIPNREVRSLYRKIIEEWLANGYGLNWYNQVLEHLLSGQLELFENDMETILKETVSSHDVSHDPEAFYHGLLIGITASLYNDKNYEIKSNRESGYGLYDYMIYSHDVNRPTLILEFKKLPKKILRTQTPETLEASLEKEAQAALKQIDEKGYITEAKQRGRNKIIKIGLAFSGKHFKLCSEKI